MQVKIHNNKGGRPSVWTLGLCVMLSIGPPLPFLTPPILRPFGFTDAPPKYEYVSFPCFTPFLRFVLLPVKWVDRNMAYSRRGVKE